MKRTILLFVVVFSFTIAQAQVLKLRKGQEFQYSTSFEGTLVQSMAGQEMVMNMSGSGNQSFVVEDLKDGIFTVLGKISLDSLVLKSAMMDSVFKPKATELEQTRYTISKLGAVLTSKPALSEKDGTNAASQMGMDMKQGFPAIPFQVEKPKAGDTWTVDKTDSIDFMGGSLVISTKSNYTFVGMTKRDGVKVLEIKVVADIANEGSTSMQGMEFFMEGTGKTAGNIFVDAKTGLLIDEEIVVENQINLALSGQQSMVIPMNQKMKQSRHLKK
ncbi:MAG: hypothetical protein PHQ65_05200 [Bacteroidales bacterium]|nr:hypothetical protein [Bacteroidales bacterium]MDD3664639.1 hypothetical protein [Bacteroidales bacterium]